MNLGLVRLIEQGDVILTMIPMNTSKTKKRPKELMVDEWLWENVIAEKVLVFNGNQVLGNLNSSVSIEALLNYL